MQRDAKKIILMVIAGLTAVLIGLRIYYVNRDVELPPTAAYHEGVFVPLGEDYFYQEREKSPGYEVKVISSKIKRYEDFLAEYGQTKMYQAGQDNPVFVIDLEVTVKNTNTEEEVGTGIGLINTRIQTVNDVLLVDDRLFSLVDEKLGGELGFRVRPGTEFTVHLPFTRPGYMDKYESESSFLHKDYYLLLSMYPTKKIIELEPVMP